MADNKVYAIVTEAIINLLDKGVVAWHKPWQGVDNAPVNIRGTKYRGINPFLLEVAALSAGYKSNVWMTYKQAAEHGGEVRKGERSTLVIFWSRFLVDAKDKDNNKVKKAVASLRYFRVFNLDQTDGVKLPKKFAPRVVDNLLLQAQAIDDAEAILGTYFAQDGAPSWAEDGGDQCYFIPGLDQIHTPLRATFDAPENFYASVFHEVGHSTAMPQRLNRKAGIEGEPHSYPLEELVAEFTSAFLCGESGIVATYDNSAAYIANWKSRLTDDPTIVVKAAAAAQKAADFVLGVTYEKEVAE